MVCSTDGYDPGSELQLSQEQATVFARVLDGLGDRQVQTVGGYAGTGKTVLVKALSGRLGDFAVCAYTGKAAHVLQQKGVDGARTVHGTIYMPTSEPLEAALERLRQVRQQQARQAQTGEGGAARAAALLHEIALAEAEVDCLQDEPAFRLRDEHELHAEGEVAGFLVDESSMISPEIHEDLLSFGLPVVFVGDHGQLPPVGNDINLMEDPLYRLETIHRNAGPIAHFAQHLRRGGHPRFWRGDGDAVRVLTKGAVTDRMLLAADQIIVATNRSRVALNRKVRDLLGRAELLEAGDRVICLRNDRRAGLFNGQQGEVTRVDLHECCMDFTADDGRLFYGVPCDLSQLGQTHYQHRQGGPHPFDYGYAITCHKAQGSEWPHVLVLEHFWPGAPWEHKRWTYTAASRAQKQLTWVS